MNCSCSWRAPILSELIEIFTVWISLNDITTFSKFCCYFCYTSCYIFHDLVTKPPLRQWPIYKYIRTYNLTKYKKWSYLLRTQNSNICVQSVCLVCCIQWLFRTLLLLIATYKIDHTHNLSFVFCTKDSVISVQLLIPILKGDTVHDKQSNKATLTTHVETGPGEHVPPATVTHQVVSRTLTRAAQVAQSDAEDTGAEHAIGVAGKPSTIQRPVERAGMQAVVGADRTRGR